MSNYNDIEKLFSLVQMNLLLSAPVLSGNTKNCIHSVSGENEFTIVIDPKYYDVSRWKREKVIVDKLKFGKESYANSVNQYGAFGSANRSMHWVNRAILDSVEMVASEMGAVVINELGL